MPSTTPTLTAATRRLTGDTVNRFVATIQSNASHTATDAPVIAAVRDAIDPDRLRNWRKLAREMARGTMTPLDRRRQLAQWKARYKEGTARTRMKRGEA
mgnify:CR=1 FL=1